MSKQRKKTVTKKINLEDLGELSGYKSSASFARFVVSPKGVTKKITTEELNALDGGVVSASFARFVQTPGKQGLKKLTVQELDGLSVGSMDSFNRFAANPAKSKSPLKRNTKKK